jgi:aminopeptidase N
MRDPTPQAIRLADYRPYPYKLDQIELLFQLHESESVVTNCMTFTPREPAAGPMRLDGQGVALLALRLDGRPLATAEYLLDGESLSLLRPPATTFTLEVTTRINPAANSALEGLYLSGRILATQCEAEGFRRITYFPDRPDVLTLFTTRLEADRDRFPVLLSNGNLIEAGDLAPGRHYAVWHDPFPKPCYLFALVAGDLRVVAGQFVTMSGRKVECQVWVEPGNEDKCDHALASLMRAMRWDEERYGREYDLDRYMIVAVRDFNMGAMENKGLNVFNARYVLASPASATDDDYINIEAVIGHEYFHNWSGNRVTCRDWFQLSLKEGFTVFRDQQFTTDMTQSAVKRIDDVRKLRTYQFAEDSGPLAHPVRPESYVEINNFYTLTVYEKGAEVVRMIHTLLGEEAFRRGTDAYFARYDGQAVTVEDFIDAMEGANGVDLSRFMRWYHQAGTPIVHWQAHYDGRSQSYTLQLRQELPPTPSQSHKLPQVIPLRLALLDAAGQPLPLRLMDEEMAQGNERVVRLEEAEQSFVFSDIPQAPLLVLGRGFSAPVKYQPARSAVDLARLLAEDRDPFIRWDAAQQLARAVITAAATAMATQTAPQLDAAYIAALARALEGESDQAVIAEILTLPDLAWLADGEGAVAPLQLEEARQWVDQEIARQLAPQIAVRFAALAPQGAYRREAGEMARRRLRNRLLQWLVTLGGEWGEVALAQFNAADNMTDSLAALTALVHGGDRLAEAALDAFYQRWQHDPLVIDKWFALQATTPSAGALATVTALMHHRDFTLTNPNRVRSLLSSLAMRNPLAFHHIGGEGYRLLTDTVLTLDGRNPQLAARLVAPLCQWRRYLDPHGDLMRKQLERIAASRDLSRDLSEVVNKSLPLHGHPAV